MPSQTLALIHLRASQINGCSSCVESGSRSAKRAGESGERLFAVAAWRQSPQFADAERAALALAEAVTRLSDRADPVPDEIWDPHLVYISIVGADGIRFSYFKAKLAAEKVIAGSSMPWTVQRATQFYDFVLSGAASMARFLIVAAPKDFIYQPIDPADVAHQLVQLALGPPSGRVPDIGGPEVSTWAEMIRQYLHAAGRRRLVMEVRMPGTGATVPVAFW